MWVDICVLNINKIKILIYLINFFNKNLEIRFLGGGDGGLVVKYVLCRWEDWSLDFKILCKC